MRNPRERLLDILEAIARIERYAALGKARFLQDELVQVWIVHHLERIGEAAARLGREFHEAHPHIPWREMVASCSFAARISPRTCSSSCASSRLACKHWERVGRAKSLRMARSTISGESARRSCK